MLIVCICYEKIYVHPSLHHPCPCHYVFIILFIIHIYILIAKQIYSPSEYLLCLFCLDAGQRFINMYFVYQIVAIDGWLLNYNGYVLTYTVKDANFSLHSDELANIIEMVNFE